MMEFALNLSALLVFCVISIQIYTRKFDKYRLLRMPENKNCLYCINQNMFFLIFIVCTAPFFLGQFSLFKYGFYFLMSVYLLLVGKVKLKIDLIVRAYILFYLWLIISVSYSSARYDSIMLLIKYIIPYWLCGLDIVQLRGNMTYFIFQRL